MPSLTHCMEKAFGKQGTSARDMTWGSWLEKHPQKESLLVHSEEALQSWVARATASSAQPHFSPPVLGLLLPGACFGLSPQNLGQHLEKWVQKGETALRTSDLKMIELWMDLEMIRLRRISQTKTNTIWYHLYVEYKKNDTNELLQNRNYLQNRLFCKTIYKTENKFMVIKGERWERRIN